MIIFFLLFFSSLCALDDDIPLLYQGRIHPAYAYSKLEPQKVPFTADPSFKALPGKGGEWHALTTLKSRSDNFTLYSNADFDRIKSSYLLLEQAYLWNNEEQIAPLNASLSEALRNAYRILEGKIMVEARGKALLYPSVAKLKAEVFLLSIPFTECLILLYALALFFNPSFFIALSLHTLYLLLRCYVLERPPVTNMYETLHFVPWVAASSALFFSLRRTAAIASMILLAVLKFSSLSDRLENVQAVLDSQYWLIVHVLMVVGSYAFFILSGLLAHLYLIKGDERMPKKIMQSLYVGTGLLIVGTILGGVWAAQSWGRFWDWDPKESWAFISSCLYLILIHLHHFHHISNRGVAIGSIIGLLSITFTWYGVNYILGAGLHSYGFGSGGTYYYMAYLLFEVCFLTTIISRKYLLKN